MLFENLCLKKKQLVNLSVSLTTFSTMEAQRTDNFSTFVGSAWSFAFSSSPQRPMTSDFEGFSIPDFIHYIYFPILILEKEAVFPFLMFSAKQENYSGIIFKTSLVSRGPGLGIEGGTSRTRCQHSTTRLSRRRYKQFNTTNLNL